MVTEKEILERLRKGDEKAFSQLVREHQKEVYMLALRILGDSEEALDVSQQVFIRALHGLRNFRGDASISTWLYKITYNLCLTQLKIRKWKRFISFENEDIITAKADNAEQEIEKQEFKQNVRNAIAKLPPQQKAVFVMHHLEGLKLAQVAQIMKRELGTVKSLHFQAVRKLREALKEWKGSKFTN
jgi:RNA polymerase sigma-70 factor (ECF subfamily)